MKATVQKQFPITNNARWALGSLSFWAFFKLNRYYTNTSCTIQTLSIMKTNYNPLNINAGNLDDIIFDGRNHAYGAYYLRKNHHKITNLSFTFAASIVISIFVISFINRAVEMQPVPVVLPEGPVVIDTYKPEIPRPPVDVKLGQSLINTASFSVPIVVPDMSNVDPSNTFMNNDDLIKNMGLPGLPDGTLDGVSTIPTGDLGTDTDVPYTKVEVSAAFNGNFGQWIGQHLRYPEVPASMGVGGMVKVQFVVNRQGKVEDVKILRGVHPDIDNEAIRVLLSSPAWTPGIQQGNPVRQLFTMTINFQVPN
jgi:periplasmic protein TonB